METLFIFVMDKVRFDVIHSSEAVDFLNDLDDKTRRKVLYNIRKARERLDPKLFKKQDEHIWGVQNRVQWSSNQNARFLAQAKGKISSCCNLAWFCEEIRQNAGEGNYESKRNQNTVFER